ncbi:hypothetical protein KP509_15G007700 [Ceratopteris richardii]|uniref:NB-ARC domain-containing protein n=1 Tax=Ceratopteris richardii TaxID=49495 RepID=A0A8T2T522_CERRI|nr:hypothetical protein KP509_15G007700 [Ceratopteris richardii]
MSRLAISPLPGAHGADGGGACPACLLSHLIRNLSSRMVSLTDSLSPSCLAYRHVAALSHLLDGFSLASASQQQNHQSSEEKLGIRDNHTRRILPNSLVQLDILRVLMLVTGKLRYLLSTIAEAYGDEASEYSAYIASAPREESGLLDHTCAEPEGCFDRWFALFKSRKVQVLKKESTNVRMVIDGSELCNSLMEVVRNLLAFSDGLVLSYENLSADLSLTVSLMTSRLTSRQPHTRCSITAHMRMLISSFLYGKEALPLTSSNMEQETHHGDRWFKRNAEVIIERLLNAGGPGIVGLGGSRGLGKTCLISHIACDERVVANFPGGVIYLCVGFDPEITYLQAQIWKQLKGSSICYSSRITFSSPEEGTAALLSRTQESLPSLLVLDDIWDAAHVKPFLCFDSYDRGRVVVISHIVEKVLANWDSDTFVHILEPLDEGETTCLFCSVAGCGALQRVHITNNCTINCTGTRRLIEAIASIHYYRKVDVSRLSSGLNLLETDGAISPGTNLRNEKVLEASGEVLRTNEGRSGEGNDFEEEDVPMQISMDSASSKFYVFFDSLSEVHPCLQENLLDLSAFPKGKWVSTSTLLNLYYVSNRMDKKRILFMLCFLASRSLIEWKVEENVDNISNEESLDNVSNEVFSFHWRLADIFYDSVQGIIQNRLGLVSKSSLMKTVRITFGEHGKDCDKHDVHGVLDLLKNAASALDECSLTNYNYSDPSAFCEHKCSSRKLVDVLSKINSNSRSDLFPFPCVSFEDDQFIFLPGLNMFSESNSWSHGDVTKVVTKLSIVSADTEFPIGLDLSKLKVLLFNESRILKSIPDRTLKHMEQLVVLDLKECAVLKMLPDSCLWGGLQIL